MAHNEGVTETPFSYVVMKSKNAVVMVDVGFDRIKYGKVLGDNTGVENWHSPAELLPEIGIKPEEVTHVILTHLHFDHAGNTQSFPKANFYLQRKELEDWMWMYTQPPEFGFFRTPIDPDDLIRVNDLLASKRLRLLDGDSENLLPGIDVYAAFDTHTYGSLWVSVLGANRTKYVMAGDNVNVYENLHGLNNDGIMIPAGYMAGSATNAIKAAFAMMNEVDKDWKRVIPVHEARLPNFYPSRKSKYGTWITEICLANSETSKI